MADRVRVIIKEVLKGERPRSFQAGDSLFIENGETPAGMCRDAFTSIAPAIKNIMVRRQTTLG